MTSNRARAPRSCAVATVSLAVAVAVGSSSAQTNPSAGRVGSNATDTIRAHMTENPNNLLSYKAFTEASNTLSSLLYARLVYMGPNGEVEGGLAHRWTVTSTEVTFHVHKDAMCSDGTTLAPSDIAASLRAYADRRTGGVNAIAAFGPNTPVISSDNGAGTVTIKLEAPWSDMLHGLTDKASGIVCPAGLADPEAAAAGKVKGAFSGAYSLTSAQPGKSYSVALTNPSFHWPAYMKKLDGVAPKHIVFSVVPDSSTAANLLITNSLDIATAFGTPIERLKHQRGITSTTYASFFYFLQFNERDGSPFAVKANRIAVAQVISAKGFNSATSAGIGEVIRSVVSNNVSCALDDNSALIPSNPSAARATLSAIPKIALLSSTKYGPDGASGKYLSAVLTEAGAQVDLSNPPVADWFQKMRTPNAWDVVVQATINPARTVYGSMSRIMGPAVENGGINFSASSNKEMQALLERAMSTIDPAQRCEALRGLQRVALQEAHFVPLATSPSSINSRTGFAQQVIGGLPEPLTMRITNAR